MENKEYYVLYYEYGIDDGAVHPYPYRPDEK